LIRLVPASDSSTLAPTPPHVSIGSLEMAGEAWAVAKRRCRQARPQLGPQPRQARQVARQADGDVDVIVRAAGDQLRPPGRRQMAQRMARREGVAAEDIVLSARDLTPYADLLREVFGRR